MAKTNTKSHVDLVQRLRASGIRRRVANDLAKAVTAARGRSKPPKAVRNVLDQLRAVTSEVEDRATGGPAKRKAAAQKAAATRKRNAVKRSTTAKKAARTRAKAGR